MSCFPPWANSGQCFALVSEALFATRPRELAILEYADVFRIKELNGLQWLPALEELAKAAHVFGKLRHRF